MNISKQRAKRVGDRLNVDWGITSLDEFTKGMNVEMEHKDVTRGSLIKTGRIALAHLREIPDYYTRLYEMERKR